MRQRYDLVFPKLAMAAPPPLLLCSLLLLLLLASPGAVGVWLNLPSSGTKCLSEEIQPNVVVLADYAVVREGDHADNLTTLAVKVFKLSTLSSNVYTENFKILSLSNFEPEVTTNISCSVTPNGFPSAVGKGGETLLIDNFEGHPHGLDDNLELEIGEREGLTLLSRGDKDGAVTSPYGYTLHEKGQVTTGQFAFTTTEAGNYLACFWIDSSDKGIGASVNLDWKIGIAAKDWNSVAKKENIEGVELELTKLEAAVHAIHDNLLYLRFREAEMRTVSEKTNSRVAWLSILSLGVCISVSILQLWHLKGFFQKKKLI
ncbi:hypothetical protein ZIOFF_002422 [Zingiber officinale]|uniref:GOLD domain-containing protein n=1 Tax=Zingiber officinale TaxID=94328 RepID=A0A8J5ILG1_ZINOF|nr:hypothetical protein ZIOFF_002422 [Zingiber officinale]